MELMAEWNMMTQFDRAKHFQKESPSFGSSGGSHPGGIVNYEESEHLVISHRRDKVAIIHCARPLTNHLSKT
jgi:hypothetical protein